jgi:hypothetical protein
MIRRFSVAAFAGAGAAAGERVDDAVADLVPPAETISVPPRTTVDALTEPSEDTINRALLPVTALAARTIDNRREVSAIMHHREARVGHLRARAWGHVWTAPWQELSDVCAALVGCGHVSGLLMRRGWPLALMLCADRVPIVYTHSEVR